MHVANHHMVLLLYYFALFFPGNFHCLIGHNLSSPMHNYMIVHD